MRSSASPFWSRLVAALAIAALVATGWKAFSDEPRDVEKPHRVPIAVLDVAKVFKHSQPFAMEMNEIKAQIEEFESHVRMRGEEIEKLAPKEAGSALPSSEQTAKAEELSRRLAADVAARRQEFLTAEAGAYYRGYTHIEKIVAQISQQRDIGLVLRYNSDEMNPADRSSVLQGVNRAVIHRAVPDLTDDLIAALNGEKH
jgi:Skp family chaperone for outer membrane proteins